MTGDTDPRRRFVGSETTPVAPPRRAIDEELLHDTRPSDDGTPRDPDLEQAAARVRRRVPTAVKVLTGLVGCFVALCVAIWAMGGFRTRNDLDDVAPGQQFSVGPVSLTLDRVEVRTVGSRAEWFVHGTCRYDLESSSAGWVKGVSDAVLLGVRDPDTNELFLNTQAPLLVLGDDPFPVVTRKDLAPGMGAVDCLFNFPMPESTPTTPTQATMVLFDLQRVEAKATSSGEENSKVWGLMGSGHRAKLPVVAAEP